MISVLERGVRALVRSCGFDITRYRQPDVPAADLEIIRAVKPYTMTTAESVQAMIRSVQHVVEHDVPGAIVECGTWRGGSMMAAAMKLLSLRRTDRDLCLFDTFEGMPKPTEVDVSYSGIVADTKFEKEKVGDAGSEWCNASLDEVRKNLHGTGYDPSRLHFAKGLVEETIPAQAPDRIAILRLDTDWYESTRHELIHLFPRLVPGGLIIIDDYGYWQGVKRATDEYLIENGIPLFLNRVDYSARIAVKVGSGAVPGSPVAEREPAESLPLSPV